MAEFGKMTSFQVKKRYLMNTLYISISVWVPVKLYFTSSLHQYCRGMQLWVCTSGWLQGLELGLSSTFNNSWHSPEKRENVIHLMQRISVTTYLFPHSVFLFTKDKRIMKMFIDSFVVAAMNAYNTYVYVRLFCHFSPSWMFNEIFWHIYKW